MWGTVGCHLFHYIPLLCYTAYDHNLASDCQVCTTTMQLQALRRSLKNTCMSSTELFNFHQLDTQYRILCSSVTEILVYMTQHKDQPQLTEDSLTGLNPAIACQP